MSQQVIIPESLNIYKKLDIISYLDDESFTAACHTDPEINMICTEKLTPVLISRFGDLTNYLYEKRVKNLFSSDIIAFKEPNMTWKEFYDRTNRLYKVISLPAIVDFYASRKNSIMEIKILLKIGKMPTNFTLLEYAIAYDNVDVLKLLISLNSLNIITQLVLDTACERESLNILKYCASLNPPLLPSQAAIDRALQLGRMEIFKFFASLNPPFLPNQNAVDYMVYFGTLDNLKYLINLNISLIPSKNIVDRLYVDNNIEKIKILANANPPILPSDEIVKEMFSNHIAIYDEILNVIMSR